MNFEKILAKSSESLVFKKDCTVGGITYTLKVLSFSVEVKLSKQIDEISASGDMSALEDWKKYVISAAVAAIDGEEIPLAIKHDGLDIERSLYLKDHYFNKLPTKITMTLFDAYTDLKEESEKTLDTNLVYNWFKDPETRKKEEEARQLAEMQEKRSTPDILSEDEGTATQAPSEEAVPKLMVTDEPEPLRKIDA